MWAGSIASDGVYCGYNLGCHVNVNVSYDIEGRGRIIGTLHTHPRNRSFSDYDFAKFFSDSRLYEASLLNYVSMPNGRVDSFSAKKIGAIPGVTAWSQYRQHTSLVRRSRFEEPVYILKKYGEDK